MGSILIMVLLATSLAIHQLKMDETTKFELQAATLILGTSFGLSLVAAFTDGSSETVSYGLDAIGNGTWFGVNIILILVFITHYSMSHCQNKFSDMEKIMGCGLVLGLGTFTMTAILCLKNGAPGL